MMTKQLAIKDAASFARYKQVILITLSHKRRINFHPQQCALQKSQTSDTRYLKDATF